MLHTINCIYYLPWHHVSSFSTNILSEELLGKVVEVLGVVLEEVKSDIWKTNGQIKFS